MSKLKFYLWNAFWSSLIGLVIFILSLLIWGWYNSFHKLIFAFSKMPLQLLYQLLFCMAVGAVIGTVSLFFVFQIFLRLTQRPLIGFISNFMVVAVLNIVGSISQGVQSYHQFIQTIWFLALIISETLSFFLIYPWYRRIMLYKLKLEEKKASLRN